VPYHIPVKEWPASEQPREKLVQLGAEYLSDAELLAILLRVGVHGQDVLSLAQALLIDRGGVTGLARTPLSSLQAVNGIGPTKAVTIRAALELGRRLLLADAHEQLQIRSPQDVASVLQIQMGLLEQEELRVVVLDTKNHVLGMPTVYRGSLNTSVIRVAEVFRDAIKQNAAAIIVVHNHPSGDPTPSPEDIRVTRDLIQAGTLLDVDVLDHLIIGRNRYVSLRQKKLGFD
jgi:DNA repair protein RadC